MLSILASLGLLECCGPAFPASASASALPFFCPDFSAFSCLWKLVGVEDVPFESAPPPSIAFAIDSFVAAELARFHVVSAEEWADTKHSSNVDPRMFDVEFAFKPNTDDKYADMDAEWKRRILVENTPRGMVYMYYWPQEQCFAYIASGQIPIPLLNACAMKYARLFRCRSLFNESKYLPVGVVGAMHTFNLAVEEKEKEIARSNRPSYLHPKIAVDPRYTVQYKQTSRAAKRSVAVASAYSSNRFKQVEMKLSYAPFLQNIPFVAPVNKTMSYADYKAKLLAEHQVDIGIKKATRPKTIKSLFQGNSHPVETSLLPRYTSGRSVDHQVPVLQSNEHESESETGSDESESETGSDESESETGSDVSEYEDEEIEKGPSCIPPGNPVIDDPCQLSVLVPENCCGTPLSTAEPRARSSPTKLYDYSSSASVEDAP